MMPRMWSVRGNAKMPSVWFTSRSNDENERGRKEGSLLFDVKEKHPEELAAEH